jgi:hypothetical protein
LTRICSRAVVITSMNRIPLISVKAAVTATTPWGTATE